MTFVRYFLVLVFTCLLAACGQEESDGAQSRGGIFARNVEKTPSRFYRVKADYIVKDTGEEINFDYVASCGGTVTHWQYSSPSVSNEYLPRLMVMAVGDYAAMGLLTPPMCEDWKWKLRRGENLIPDDWMPFITWYPDINDLRFGIGYRTEAAYESPYAKIEFKGASLALATEKEWRSWRKEATKGYEVIGGMPGPWGYSWEWDPKPVHDEVNSRNGPSGLVGRSGVRAVGRIKMPEELRDAYESMAASDPSESNRYWLPLTRHSEELDPVRIAYEAGAIFENDRKLEELVVSGDYGRLGILRRSGVGYVKHISRRHQPKFIEAYPVMPLDLVEDGPDSGIMIRRILIKPEWEGFSLFSSAGQVTVEALERYSRGEVDHLPVDYSFDPYLMKGKFLEKYDVHLHINDEFVRGGFYFQNPKNEMVVDFEGGYLITKCCAGF